MSAQGLGRVKTPTFNLRVEIPSRFRKFENQKCLRPPIREDDRENNSAHSWLAHVFTQPWSKPEKLNASTCFPLCPRERTSRNTVDMSVSCQHRTHALQQSIVIRSPHRHGRAASMVWSGPLLWRF